MLDGPGGALSELGVPGMGGGPAAIFGGPKSEVPPLPRDPKLGQSATELPPELLAALMGGQSGGRPHQERAPRRQGPPRAPRGLPQNEEAQMAMLHQMLAQGGEMPMPTGMQVPPQEDVEPPAVERYKVDPKVHELLDKPIPEGPTPLPKPAEKPKITTWGELIKYVWGRIKTSFQNMFK